MAQRNRTRITSAAVHLTALVTLVMLSGCTAVESAGWTRPELADPVPAYPASKAMPFDSYTLSRAERAQMQVGMASLLNACLGEYALSATFAGDYIRQEPSDPGAPLPVHWGGRLGTLTEVQASEHGYNAPSDAPWQNGPGIYLSSPANLFPVPSSDPIWNARVDAALYGPERAVIVQDGGSPIPLDPKLIPLDRDGNEPPAGGCFSIVEDRIGTPLVDQSQIALDVYNLTFDDERFAEANRRWYSCMQAAGYDDFERVDQAASETGGATTPESIEIAVADVRCTAASEWPATFYNILAAYQAQAIQKQPELFQSALAAERERLLRINDLQARTGEF